MFNATSFVHYEADGSVLCLNPKPDFTFPAIHIHAGISIQQCNSMMRMIRKMTVDHKISPAFCEIILSALRSKKGESQ